MRIIDLIRLKITSIRKEIDGLEQDTALNSIEKQSVKAILNAKLNVLYEILHETLD